MRLSFVMLARLSIPLLLVAIVQQGSTRLTITGSSPAPGTILPQGSTATLTCTSSAPWFLCIWEGPGGVACQCQTQVGGVNAMCQGYPRYVLFVYKVEKIFTKIKIYLQNSIFDTVQ
jgi:hypothetical protein